MLDTDPRLRDGLERLLPLPDIGESDWNEVVRRLEHDGPERSRRWFAVAAIAVVLSGGVAVSPVGGAIAREVGDFSAWLRGDPGTPASADEQREFERANERSWGGFPSTPKLRRLLEHQAAGIDYTLYGFRTGNSLCLRLVAGGTGSEPAMSCAPLDELRNANAPAVVLLTDHPFGSRPLPADAEPGEYTRARGSATFGIVADGVQSIELQADDGRHEGLIGGNAFLYVAPDPAVGTRVTQASATDASGARFTLPLAIAPFGMSGGAGVAARPPLGPAQVERKVEGGSIGWLERREPRGDPIDQAGPFGDRIVFGRLLRPDPSSFMRVRVVLVDRASNPAAGDEPDLCYGVLRGGLSTYGCARFRDYFGHRNPSAFRVGVEQFGGDQYSLVSGIASDDVARVELYLATGERVSVPLKDNVFFAQAARARFPARLVAYDALGAVIGVQTFDAERGARPIPSKERVVLMVEGRGSTAILRVAPSTDGGRCWRITYSSGSAAGGCPPKNYRQRLLDAVLIPAGPDVFVQVQVRDEVDVVVIEPTEGEAVPVRPTEGFAIHPLATDAREVVVTVRALATDGRELARRQVKMQR